MMERMIGNKDRELLKQCTLFSGMDDVRFSEALWLLEAEIKEYRKGAFLHHAGEMLTRFGFVLSGSVQAMSDDPDGNRMIMANVIPGGTFGESLCYLRIPDSPAYIRASANARILWLSLRKIYAEQPQADELSRDLRKRFTAMLAERTLLMNRRIQVLSAPSIREKLLTFFTHAANRAGSRNFTISMNREDLAAYIGADRSAVSRELSRMKRDGLIDYDRNTFRIIRFE